MTLPRIIQGGMGIGVSNWRLARTVSQAGQLGVVSGTAIEVILARRLQDGDPGGHMRRALAQFPNPEIARRILDAYFLPNGRAPGQPYKAITLFTRKPDLFLWQLTVAANFAEVWLAKEGHAGLVGVNYLEKIQLPHVGAIYGAMLAGVDYVIMGAGIPRQIPDVLDRLAAHEPAAYRLHVLEAAPEETFTVEFSPRETVGPLARPLRRPSFLPIVSSATLAVSLARKAGGRIDGFVVEGPLAGGHNAPPRVGDRYNERGEPVYGDEDKVDVARLRALGLPFWLAGSWADPEKLQHALDLGAAGIQVGTAFAFCEESGMDDGIKREVIRLVQEGRTDVYTDPRASPAGFPFKMAGVPGSLSEPARYRERSRVCDIGLLRSYYRRSDGSVGYRCAAEPETAYAAKGGREEDCEGRKCICNGLLAAAGLPQTRASDYVEKPIVTAGDDLHRLGRFLSEGSDRYSAQDVLNFLLAPAL